MHTVAQVIDRNFERSWYECVAIVQAVLSEVAPGGLRDLVTGNQKEPPTHDSVEGLSRALAFYERPNRSAEILAVYHRLSRTQTAGPTSTEAEFERLRERVASQGRVPHE